MHKRACLSCDSCPLWDGSGLSYFGKDVVEAWDGEFSLLHIVRRGLVVLIFLHTVQTDR